MPQIKYDELFDEDSFVRTNSYMFSGPGDDLKAYGDTVITGYGLIEGRPVYAACVDGSYMYGSFGRTVAEKISSVIYAAKYGPKRIDQQNILIIVINAQPPDHAG